MNILPLRSRLDREKKKSGITFETIQQDYLLSWLLSGLYEHPSLKEQLIFKGGTALKKCYFGNYRFSEDLDFSVISSIPKKAKLEANLNRQLLIHQRNRIQVTDIGRSVFTQATSIFEAVQSLQTSINATNEYSGQVVVGCTHSFMQSVLIDTLTAPHG
ncbi:MAG: nucleotidyl transferase AbiEii/AbiGii toxin family protein [Simkaniaceae bacterium]|nr:nucleotidyl transferase AbiEii/AbiGii toxin family protein [Simkaniaceae bacterium]MCF7852681.1 nucleotidyl transferase AbiEii/AbiGii toxin family protein [Simkaniaceae bacterium]